MNENIESGLHQQLMDQAYARWQKHNAAVQAAATPPLKAFDQESNEWHAAVAQFRQQMWTKEQFWAQLSDLERIAVHTGNLVYQVENGGWSQWCENDYVDCAYDLLDILAAINTPAAIAVRLMVERVVTAWEHYQGEERSSGDDLDREAAWDDFDAATDALNAQFYDLDTQFLADVEAHLQTLVDAGVAVPEAVAA